MLYSAQKKSCNHQEMIETHTLRSMTEKYAEEKRAEDKIKHQNLEGPGKVPPV